MWEDHANQRGGKWIVRLRYFDHVKYHLWLLATFFCEKHEFTLIITLTQRFNSSGLEVLLSVNLKATSTY